MEEEKTDVPQEEEQAEEAAPQEEAPQREMHTVTCAECGNEAQVPFKPDGKRPVYCKDCYQKHRPPRREY